MHVQIFAAGCAALALATATGSAADTIVLRNLRANVEIIPEDRTDITVTVDANGAADPPLVVSRTGGAVTVTGQMQTGQRGYRVSFNLDRGMDVAAMKRLSQPHRDHPANLPNIVFHTPMKLRLKSNAFVFGHIGPSQSLNISDIGDGEWRVDAVSGDVTLDGNGGTDFTLSTSRIASIGLMGTGNVTLGDTDSLYSGQYGSGTLKVGKVARLADITVSGVGDLKARSVSGVAHVLITDAGGVAIDDGEASKLTVRTLDGLGAVDFGGTVKDVDINIGTAAKVHIHKVTGTVRKTTREAATLVIDGQ